MKGEITTSVEMIFGATVTFCALNAFLISIENTARWDFLFANSAIVIASYFAYLTKEIIEIKETLKNSGMQIGKMTCLLENKKGQLQWIPLAVMIILAILYLYVKSRG